MKFKPLLLIVLAGLSACKSEEQKGAEGLLSQAQELVRTGDYQAAIQLIDSLNTTYPKQVDARRESTALRTRAMKEYSEQQYALTDSIIDMLTPQVQAYEDRFRHVPGIDALPGYFVANAAYAPNFSTSTGLQARVSDEDYSISLVAINSGKPIGINQVILTTDDGQSMSTAAIPSDSPRCGDTDAFGSDLATFTYNEIKPLAEWLADNAPRMKYATLVGNDGQTSVQFSPAQAQAIVESYQFSDIAFRLQAARVLNQKLERQLIIARDHAVNLE